MTTNNDLKTDVRSLLKYGRENALTGKELAKTLGFPNNRVIRQAIRELIKDSVPIAASTVNPCGFFIATSKDEVGTYALILRKRLIEDAIRRRDFLRASKPLLYPCQLEMQMET